MKNLKTIEVHTWRGITNLHPEIMDFSFEKMVEIQTFYMCLGYNVMLQQTNVLSSKLGPNHLVIHVDIYRFKQR